MPDPDGVARIQGGRTRSQSWCLVHDPSDLLESSGSIHLYVWPVSFGSQTEHRCPVSGRRPFTGVGLQTGGEPPGGVLDGVGVQIGVFLR